MASSTRMNEHWFRYFHGTPADPKWKVVAARASHTMSRHVTIAHVLAVWDCMMECASQAIPRGELCGWDSEDVAALLEIEVAEVEAIRQAMQGKTLDGNHLKAWEKRQPKRERDDPSASSRKAAQRLRDSGQKHDVTPIPQVSHQVTPRGEERREEEKEQDQILSVGKPETNNSRATLAEPPTARADPGERSGQIAKLLKANGVQHVNPTHAKILELAAYGVTDAEVVAIAKEAVERGKPNLSWACSTLLGRKRDAAVAPPTSMSQRNAPLGGSGAHRPYVREERNIDPVRSGKAEAQAMVDIMKNLHIRPKEPEPDEAPPPNS